MTCDGVGTQSVIMSHEIKRGVCNLGISVQYLNFFYEKNM